MATILKGRAVRNKGWFHAKHTCMMPFLEILFLVTLAVSKQPVSYLEMFSDIATSISPVS